MQHPDPVGVHGDLGTPGPLESQSTSCGQAFLVLLLAKGQDAVSSRADNKRTFDMKNLILEEEESKSKK